MLLRRLLVASAVLACGIFAVAPNAKAGSVNVPFASQVTGTCNFGSAAQGVLIATSSSLTTGSGGAPGAVSLSCNSSANFELSPPTPTSADAIAYMAQSGISCYSNVGYPIYLSNYDCSSNASTTYTPGTLSLGVDMAVSGQPVPSGNYTFDVTLTATPL